MIRRIAYSILLATLLLLSCPFWLRKAAKRKGLNHFFLEKFACFSKAKKQQAKQLQSTLYFHAVSVGETNIALKLATSWLDEFPQRSIVIAVTTPTAYQTACKKVTSLPQVTIIYAPFDFHCLLRRTFRLWQPQCIVLIESEIWPAMTAVAKQQAIPIMVANARLSTTSEKRIQQFAKFCLPMYQRITQFFLQDKQDFARYQQLGIASTNMQVVGNIKYDTSKASHVPQSLPSSYQQLLQTINPEQKPFVFAISTFPQEETYILQQLLKIKKQQSLPFCFVLVPRHVERSKQIIASWQQQQLLSWHVLSDKTILPSSNKDLLLIDSTGELPLWLTIAKIAIIGKSWYRLNGQYGGQNLVEPLQLNTAVITGPYMQNFQPITEQLQKAKAINQLDHIDKIFPTVFELLAQPKLCQIQVTRAKQQLQQHNSAITKTLRYIADIYPKG